MVPPLNTELYSCLPSTASRQRDKQYQSISRHMMGANSVLLELYEQTYIPPEFKDKLADGMLSIAVAYLDILDLRKASIAAGLPTHLKSALKLKTNIFGPQLIDVEDEQSLFKKIAEVNKTAYLTTRKTTRGRGRPFKRFNSRGSRGRRPNRNRYTSYQERRPYKRSHEYSDADDDDDYSGFEYRSHEPHGDRQRHDQKRSAGSGMRSRGAGNQKRRRH
jgi:hypothetical protein